MPKNLAIAAKKIIEEEKFATKSKFFRHLLRLKLESRLVKELAESRKELAAGKGKLLESIKSLQERQKNKPRKKK